MIYEAKVRTLPSWCLRLMLRMPLMGRYRSAAFLELWWRSIEADDQPLAKSGSWPISLPDGHH